MTKIGTQESKKKKNFDNNVKHQKENENTAAKIVEKSRRAI